MPMPSSVVGMFDYWRKAEKGARDITLVFDDGTFQEVKSKHPLDDHIQEDLQRAVGLVISDHGFGWGGWDNKPPREIPVYRWRIAFQSHITNRCDFRPHWKFDTLYEAVQGIEKARRTELEVEQIRKKDPERYLERLLGYQNWNYRKSKSMDVRCRGKAWSSEIKRVIGWLPREKAEELWKKHAPVDAGPCPVNILERTENS